ncbi:MAG: hypothetical protein K8T25_21355 [Planctomycetia bacterium]|nr:hypothetical protein [Planctomycetia bacterium]
MPRSFLVAMLAICLAMGSMRSAQAADPPSHEDDTVENMQPVMVSLADRDAPSAEEWKTLHDEPERAGQFGSLGDLKSQTISFMNTQYFTANRIEGTLASYGKMDGKNRFDRYGHISGVEFDVPSNSWKERYALNAAALVKLTGRARFKEFAGVELDTAVNDRRQIEVTFVGTIVPKDEAIRRLNADVDALEYLTTLHLKKLQFKKGWNLLASPAPPPAPKVVLANVIMLDGKSSASFDGNLAGKAETVIHGIGGELKLSRQTGEEIALLTPVVRCYRTYSIEFKTDADGKLEYVTRADREGRPHQVPVIFDLTPDL